MKPCRNFRKPIALHAADALEPGEASAVRQHLAECPACREYFNAMQAVSGDHRRAGLSLAGSEPLPERLLDRVSEQLDSCENSRASARPISPIRLWLPRLAWPVAALAVAAFLWLQIDPRKTTKTEPSPLPTVAADHRAPSSQMAYRMALNQSFEQLDLVLAETADHAAASPARSLYQSRLELADSGF